MLTQLIAVFTTLAGMYLFVSWLSYHEASRINGEQQSRRRHPAGKKRTN
jgi:hypothetical protein